MPCILVCSRVDYCNSLLIDFLKIRLSVLRTVAVLIARLHKFSHTYLYMVNQLHWLLLTARIDLWVLVLVLKKVLA